MSTPLRGDEAFPLSKLLSYDRAVRWLATALIGNDLSEIISMSWHWGRCNPAYSLAETSAIGATNELPFLILQEVLALPHLVHHQSYMFSFPVFVFSSSSPLVLELLASCESSLHPWSLPSPFRCSSCATFPRSTVSPTMASHKHRRWAGVSPLLGLFFLLSLMLLIVN
jgi:hypothetical protein